MKQKRISPPPQRATPAAFNDVQRATSLTFYLRDHFHSSRGAGLLTELMAFVGK